MNKQEILRPRARIHGGVRLPHLKAAAEIETGRLPVPEQVIIPMVQHIGAPCTPLVKKGDPVFVGTKIGDSDAFVSAPIHSSVSGTVSEIKLISLPNGSECQAVVILADGNQTPDPALKPVTVTNAEQLASAARDCGLVGLGGAGFPTHIKLAPGKKIDTLIVNGAECEPFITSDYRACMEDGAELLSGIYLIQKLLNIEQVIIAVENNKPAAIQKLYEIAADKADAENRVKLMKLPARYPQGAEKVLIYSATGRKLPAGKLPADVGCLVMNVTSIVILSIYLKTGMPLTQKRITVDGNAVAERKNLFVPIGTPVCKVLEFCNAQDAQKVLLGGPMMGIALANPEQPLTKQNNAVLAFCGKAAQTAEPTACIRCGRCARVCPMRLTPAKVDAAVIPPDETLLQQQNVNYCMECGCCAYMCPAHRPLVQSMRLAKNILKKAAKK